MGLDPDAGARVPAHQPGLTSTQADVDAAARGAARGWSRAPGAVAQADSAALAGRADGLTCASWRRCPAASTRPWPQPVMVARRARRHGRAPGAVAQPRDVPAPARGAAARSRTPATPAGSRTCWASRSTSGTCRRSSPRTSSTTSSPSTPQGVRPTRACAATSGSSSRPCWTGRWRSGFDAVCTGHYARLVDGRDGLASCTAPSTPARTSPTCSACSTPDQLAGCLFPLGDSTEDRTSAREAAELGLLRRGQARQPRHLLHPQR